MNNNPDLLESYYQRYIQDLKKWLPDGIIEVDLELLHKLNLLHYHGRDPLDSALTRYFQVVESDEKLTLANEEFVVWIVPDKIEETAVTYTLIALNRQEDLQLELVFMTRGIYNNSYLVLRLLEKFLMEIQGTQQYLEKLEHSST